MMTASRRAALSFVLVVALSMVGTAIAQKPGGTLRIYNSTNPPSASIHEEATIAAVMPFTAIFNNLVQYDPLKPRNTFETIVPELAESWSLDDTRTKLTFKLRQGVKWHDGKPFTSADVQYTAMEMWKKHLNYGTTLQLYLDAVETPDAQTAVFRYSRPMPLDLLLRALADLGYIAPKHVYEGTNVLENPANTAPIGTGPFKFSKYERGQYVIAVRNENYWRKGFPYLDQIIWRFIPDPAAAVAAIESGQIQMSAEGALPLADLDRLKKDPKFEVSSRGNEGNAVMNTIEFNFRRKEIADPRVREAILRAAITPVDAGSILQYPRLVGVRRTTDGHRARLVLGLVGA